MTSARYNIGNSDVPCVLMGLTESLRIIHLSMKYTLKQGSATFSSGNQNNPAQARDGWATGPSCHHHFSLLLSCMVAQLLSPSAKASAARQ